MGLTNAEYADFELLQTIEREPRSLTIDLATILDREHRAVAGRLGWMLRMGLAERTSIGAWILTKKGRELLNGRSNDILALRDIASRARRSDSLSWVMRREARRDLG